MASLYASERLLRRQPCAPSASSSSGSSMRLASICPSRRRQTLAWASLAQHEPDFSMQQHYQPPDWHPQLHTRFKGGKRSALEGIAREYYNDVWNNGELDLLSELVAPGVVLSDTLGLGDDAFGVAGLRECISDFQATHPLLRYVVEDVIVDDERNMVAVHYSVTAAHLLPSAEGAPATGHVSTVAGMDKIKFNRFCRITSIHSYRQRFLDEEAQMIDWDTV